MTGTGPQRTYREMIDGRTIYREGLQIDGAYTAAVLDAPAVVGGMWYSD